MGVLAASSMQAGTLKTRIDSIINGKRMTVGVYAECGRRHFSFNGNKEFPMMSVFKVHVALTVLDKLDREGISTDTVIHVRRSQIHDNTYSPMRGDYPVGDIRITVSRLIEYSVSQSDNNACDILLDIAGGVKAVDSYIRRLGIRNFKISETEASMHDDLHRVYNNSSTPHAMVQLLKAIDGGRKMPRNIGVLISAMEKAKTGLDKIAAGLPKGALLLHKTGSSDRIDGVKTADNDAAIIRFPASGRTVFIVVFIKESSETDAVNASVIAAITRSVVAGFLCDD